MKKFDLSAIMCKAWKLYRKGVGSFAEALHRAWRKGSVSGGAYPQQQGGRPNLQGIILRRFSGQTTTL